MGPLHPHSDQVHQEKYREPGEGFREQNNRVAAGLADGADHYDQLREITGHQRFMFAGRIQAAIGSPKHITAYNCFVAPTIHDSFVHGDETGSNSIMDIARKAATTMRMGGGIGYDFSTLRPARDLIKGVQAATDGPLAFMPIFDATCRATSSAGNRRGAQMGVLRIDHPDIAAFIRAKQPNDKVAALWEYIEELDADHPQRLQLVMALQDTLTLTGFNISVGVTNKFMECLRTGEPFPLTFGGKIYNYVNAAELWETLMRSTWDWAEPGVLFIDSINDMNNLWYAEQIAATNPCGEQPLPPNGACLLGSFNLAKYVIAKTSLTQKGRWAFDWDQFQTDIAPVVRALDNVIDRTHYPLDEQRQEAQSKRRMGIGITGLANAAEALGHAYGSRAFLEFEHKVLTILRDFSYAASVKLAREKGAFPLFDSLRYGQSKFIQTLDTELQVEIAAHGIRNSHLTSIAPTGTISYTADNVSSSIEPVFMVHGQRKMKLNGGEVIVDVVDYGFKTFGVEPKTADLVTADEHVDVLCTAANLVDSAVSKTCNVSPDMPWEDFKGLYVRAFENGAKGCTTFNPGGKRLGIFTAKKRQDVSEDEGASCTFDPESGRRSCE